MTALCGAAFFFPLQVGSETRCGLSMSCDVLKLLVTICASGSEVLGPGLVRACERPRA